MSIKEELAELEREEIEEDCEEARLNAIEADICRLYRRISVIVEYVDKGEPKEEPLTEEEMWECGFDAGFEEGEKHAITEAAKKQTKEESTSDTTAKAIIEKMLMDNTAEHSNDYKTEIIKTIQAALAMKTPGDTLHPLMEVLAMQSTGSKEETDETKEINKKLLDAMQKMLRVVTPSPTVEEPKEKDPEKETGAGLGRKVGDV